MTRTMHRWGAPLVLAVGVSRDSVLACATCFGGSDSAMAQGMNAGILSLLAVVGCVLAGVAAFFVFLALRSARSGAARRAAERSPEYELAETFHS